MNYSQLLRIVFSLWLGYLQSASPSSNNNSAMLVENIATFQTQCSSRPSVTNCKNFIKERNKLSIRQNILTKLDLREEFKNAKFPKVPQKIIDEYMNELRLEQDYQSDQATVHTRLSGYSAHHAILNEPEDHSVPPKSIIIFNQIYPKIRHKCSRRQDVLYFPISNSTLNFNVQSARLHFAVNVKQYHQNKSNFVLQIFKGCNRKTEEAPYVPSNRFSSTTTNQWVEPQVISHGHNAHITSISLTTHNLRASSWWVEVDVTKYVAKWFKNNSDNNNNSGITFTVFEENDRLEINTGADYTNLQRPYVTVNIIDKRKTRKKRSPDPKCTEEDRDQHCCRYPLMIDFDEFGWEFIIAPRQYHAYYCAGDCPTIYKQHHAHTFIAQMSSAAIGPCCSPREYGNISMLYFDPDYNIRFSNLPGMVVNKCGCS